MVRPVRERDPIDYHDVSLALSKAKAAWWFLDAANADYIDFGSNFTDPKAIPRTEEEANEVKAWLTSWCLDNLHDALREAEAAFRKSAAASPELRDEAKR